MEKRPKMTFIILPVGLDCNLACRYCYHGVVSKKQETFPVMSNEILKRIITGASTLATDADFLWHGGEPLLAGMDHFKRALAFQEKTKFEGRVKNILQSNLTLMSKARCSFFAEKNFVLSTSIDGGKKVHDANRVFPGGAGTHSSVVNAISNLRAIGKPIGAVSLITKDNVHHPAQTFQNLKNSGIASFTYHFCAQDEELSIDVIPSQEELLSFAKEVFDLWLEDDNPDFRIRNFRNVIRVMCGGRPIDCASNVNGCKGFIAITASGDVYPCHRYVERKNFCIGNVLERSLFDIYQGATETYEEMCSIDERCLECEWLKACGGGCAFERLVTNGSFKSLDPECMVKKALFEHIRKRTKHFFDE